MRGPQIAARRAPVGWSGRAATSGHEKRTWPVLKYLDKHITASAYYKPVTELAALQVLAEPRRVAILDVLRDGETPVNDLVGRLGLSQPAVSKHLRVLREAGLVEARVDAQRRLYRIRPEPLADLDQWLASYRALWTTHLDRLENHLDERRKT